MLPAIITPELFTFLNTNDQWLYKNTLYLNYNKYNYEGISHLWEKLRLHQ